MPTVSYVVTVYNKSRYLGHVIAGLAAQTGDFDREFIFIEDGSTDDSAAALQRLAAGLPNASIVRQANAGPAVATNVGFARANGDFIKPLDADDVLAPAATATLLRAMAETGAPWAHLSAEHQATYDADAAPQAALAEAGFSPATLDLRPYVNRNALRDTLKRAQTNPSAWLASRAAVEAADGADERIFVQDYSMELRLAAHASPAVIAAPLMAIPRQMQSRLSENQHQLMHDGALTIAHFLEDGGVLPDELAAFALRRHAERAWKWASRRAGQEPGSPAFWAFMRAVARVDSPTAAAFRRLAALYAAHRPIRRAPGGAFAGLRARSARPQPMPPDLSV